MTRNALEVNWNQPVVAHDYGYTVHDEINSISDLNSAYTRGYGYGALSRLTSATGTNANQTFTLDANGNRNQHAWQMLGGTTNTVNSTIDTASNRLLSEHFAFTHDGAGNRTSQTWAGTTATYRFDHFNRLRSVSRDAAVTYENPDSGTVSLSAGNSAYLYSALDERVQKTALGTTTTFIPSGPGQILAENKGGTWTNYLWFNGELVGIQRAGTTYYSFNDHLGRPEQLRDSNQSVVWQSLSGAFSRRILQDNIGGLNIGFPGQYYDTESDLWQNGYRDYDARNGRYIEADPIGTSGGTNLYTYAKQNPITAIDLLGLTSCDITSAFRYARAITRLSSMSGLDISMPKTYDVVNISGDRLGGTVRQNIFRPIQIDSQFLEDLSDSGLILLLDTVLHEGLHRQRFFNWLKSSDKDDQDHIDKNSDLHRAIYTRAHKLSAEFGPDFVHFARSQCSCD